MKQWWKDHMWKTFSQMIIMMEDVTWFQSTYVKKLTDEDHNKMLHEN